MDPHRFLTHRVVFSGLPYGELEIALDKISAGESWERSFLFVAARLRRIARQWQRGGGGTAPEPWLWATVAYHAASFDLHLEARPEERLGRALRLRRLARACYQRALAADPSLARAVRIPTDHGEIAGYLRRPEGEAKLVVILFNGLDSLCEVEMHAFGNRMLRRSFAVLSLDLPAAFNAKPRRPLFAVEQATGQVADWLAGQAGLGRVPLAAFGVSFGGHLVARAMGGDARFRAGVAVSPAAWLDRHQLGLARIRAMLRLAFDLDRSADVDAVAARIHLATVPPPQGRVLLFEMEQDELFRSEHSRAIQAWGGESVEVRRMAAEHVGTSRIHLWLPQACDWLEEQAAEQRSTNPWRPADPTVAEPIRRAS